MTSCALVSTSGPKTLGSPGRSMSMRLSLVFELIYAAFSSPPRRSSVAPTHHGIERGHRRDHVGDLAADRHRRRRLQIYERRLAQMDPVRPGAAVRDDMGTELAARTLDCGVDLTGRHPEALGHQLEVMDQRLHRGVHDLVDVRG